MAAAGTDRREPVVVAAETLRHQARVLARAAAAQDAEMFRRFAERLGDREAVRAFLGMDTPEAAAAAAA